jgi:type I restriction-modification system DNA methylase subunit
MEIEELKKFLHSPYQGSKSFVEHIIFPIFGQDDYEDNYDKEWLEEDSSKKSLALATGVESVKQVGSMYIDVEPLVIFDITVSDRVRMERNRQGIQKLVRQMMGPYSCAFMLFHYQDMPDWDWRFSFMHKGDKDSTSTSAKRYTFLLGPRQSCLTAAINFHELYELHGSINEEALEKAFSVEALSNEFFKRYKNYYENFVSYITGKAYRKEGNKWVEKVVNTDNDKEFYARFDHNDKRIRDYVKRLLGRITFLHFVQKKGWLGVPAGQDWNSGKGNFDFMRQLFLQASEQQKDDFLDAVLEPLFNAIDTDRKDDDYLFDTGVLGKVRIPYLNGGLFERNEDDRIPSRFPKELFANLLQFFSEYNFTVDENDPDDAQVGIDPEMLSRIFENLLEDNKDKGAYYTPKEVVHYMCRESLIAYLQTDYKDKKQQDNIRHFVETQEVDGIEPIKDNIDSRLKEVKICDPAIGSGAFPMGMLKEIFLCRSVLEDVTDAAQIKREIIQNNIYGVDIEKGAVEIARLRFWLSLIVDEKSPETLPNLDYKIMQGNSLLTTFRGQYVDLDIHGHTKGSTAALNLNMTRLAQAQKKLFNAEGEEKLFTQINIKLIIVESVIAQLQYEFDSFTRANNTVQGTLNFGTTNEKKIAKVVIFPQERMEILQECLRLKEQLLDDTVSRKVRAEMALPFFDWHMMFNDVFSRPSKEGFDIVIGNPPYVSAPTQLDNNILKKQRQDIVECKKFKTLNEKWDLYVPFMELGLQLLAEKGIFTMIVPYPLSNQKYAKKIRKLITEKTCILEIADLNGTKIFENATVSNCIPILRKDKPAESLSIIHINDNRQFLLALSKPVSELVQDEKTYVWNLSNEQRQGSRFPNMNVLGDFCYISKGMVLNADEKTAKGEFSKDDLISEIQDDVHCRKYIEAKDIDKYEVRHVRYLEWNTERCPGQLSRPTFRELYEQPKIIMNCLGTINATIDESTHFLHNHSIYCAVPWKFLHAIENKSISTSVKRYSRMNRNEMEKLSDGIDLYYLLAILNSSTADKLLADQRGGDYHIYPEHLRNLPIAPASAEEQKFLGGLAKSVLERKAHGEETKLIEDEIDFAVRKLYKD